eukprot:gnl/TRDRNA2_/TRDRNA2_151979_c1_seq1.p1 gnl/TRDRNA2_/TRDRNA2_151979_c1~~gnl/TRDRNA2_/TRDRNA2_151979_c1_seq1.p1  ORF type:complete len:278 (-),score=24.36 gnl/TRDRNA2_/TRDRNA2_151979_c1_seq1:127-837(-)
MGACTALGANAVRRLGIVPRTLGGLPGIIFGCFVHVSWSHFVWNAFGFLLLGLCVLRVTPATLIETGSEAGEGTSGGSDDGCICGRGVAASFAAASVFIALTSGFCVWCLGRPAFHAGASGIVCGYVGLLLAIVLRRRDVPLGPLLMVLAVVASYGSAALLTRPAGMTRPYCTAPGECVYPGHGRLSLYEACKSPTTSSEHHTFGFLSGLASVLFFCRGGGRRQAEQTTYVNAAGL